MSNAEVGQTPLTWEGYRMGGEKAARNKVTKRRRGNERKEWARGPEP